MILEFRIWGLIILLLLLIFSSKKKDNNFSLVLGCGYLLEFIYVLCYILHQNGLNIDIFMKIYYICFFVCYSMITYFFVMECLKNKNKISKGM